MNGCYWVILPLGYHPSSKDKFNKIICILGKIIYMKMKIFEHIQN